MIAPAKLVVCAAIVAAALLGAVARPATASAAPPCWKLLLTDWYDGRIDHTYPIHCYTEALKHLPADVQTYSSAHDDIFRALQSARNRLRHGGQSVTPNTPVPPSSNDPTSTTPTTSTDTTAPSPGRDQGKGLSHLADKLNPSSPSSLPLPLLVLGALALLLVAAGGAGLLVKRRQDGQKPAS